MSSESVQKGIFVVSALALVFIVFSCTVAPAMLFASELAADTVTITNSATAKSSTGGTSGQNGADGQDGQDGKDGAQGSGGSTGASSAHSSVETYVDGELVESEQVTTTTGGGATATVTTTHSTTTTTHSAVETASSSDSEVRKEVEVSVEKQSVLQKLTNALQSFIGYVGTLF